MNLTHLFRSSRLTVAVCAMLLFPSVYGATYYLDAVSGLDSNAGTSSGGAWQTLARANNGPLNNGGNFAPGDSILLKRGQTYSGQLAPKGSGTPSAGATPSVPITIATHGSGALPVINNPVINMAFGNSAIYLRNVQAYTVRDLVLTAPRGSGGIIVTIDHSGTYKDFILDNLVCREIGTSSMSYTTTEQRNSGGIIFNNSLTTASPGKFDKVEIRNCTVYNILGVGIQAFAKTTNETVPTALRMTQSVIRNCVVHLCYCDGIIWRGADAALIEYCTVFDTGNTADHAMVGLWIKQNDGSTIQYCESFLNTGNATDSQGYDFDVDVDNSILQYSYSHDNDGGMLLVCANDTGLNVNTGNIARFNLSENDARAMLTCWGRIQNNQFYHNTVYASSGTNFTKVVKLAADYVGSAGAPNLITNNIIYSDHAATLDVNSTMSWNYNTFYGTGLASLTLPSGTGNVSRDPQIFTKDSAGVGRGSVLGYRLNAASSERASATVVLGNGGFDYFHGTVSATTPDRGALQYVDPLSVGFPSVPTALAAVAPTSGHVVLTWSYAGTDDIGFKVQRRVGAAAFASIAAAGSSERRFVDASAVSGTTYDYQVIAMNQRTQSAASTSVSITVP